MKRINILVQSGLSNSVYHLDRGNPEQIPDQDLIYCPVPLFRLFQYQFRGNSPFMLIDEGHSLISYTHYQYRVGRRYFGNSSGNVIFPIKYISVMLPFPVLAR